MIHAYKGFAPKIHPTAFVEASAQVIGDVELAEEASVWFNTVVRGDVNRVRIGRGTNIQDGANCLIGIGAIVLDGVVLEEECLVAAGALVAPGTKAPRGSVLMGAPATVKRSVTPEDLDLIHRSARNYVHLRADYLAAQGG